MSILIDKIINNNLNRNLVEINNKWYIARPLKDGRKWRLSTTIQKIKNCYRIITDRGLVIHFKQDE